MHFSHAQGNSLPDWFQGKFYGFVCFELLVKRTSSVYSCVSPLISVTVKSSWMLCVIEPFAFYSIVKLKIDVIWFLCFEFC